MYFARSDEQVNKEKAEQQRQQQAEQVVREQQAVAARENPAYDDCSSTLHTVFDAIAYVVCCCGCCTSWDDYINDTYD